MASEKKTESLFILAIALASISLFVFILMFLRSEDFSEVNTTSASTYSRSAIGYKALHNLLEELKIKSLVSRNSSGRLASQNRDNLLILAEPTDRNSKDTLGVFYDDLQSPNILLILPKWSEKASREKVGFSKVVKKNIKYKAREILLELDPDLNITPSSLHSQSIDWEFSAPLKSRKIELSELQLLETSDLLTPLISCDEGVLFAKYHDPYKAQGNNSPNLFIISDPDLMQNHGLHRGENAQQSIEIIEHIRKQDGVVIFDEVHHGFGFVPSVLSHLARFPMATLSLHGLLALALLLWSGMSRFGSAIQQKENFKASREQLSENIVRLLTHGGHEHQALEPYSKAIIQSLCKYWHIDSKLNWSEKLQRLDGLNRSEIQILSLQSKIKKLLLQKKTQKRDDSLIRCAQQLHLWKQEMSLASH